MDGDTVIFNWRPQGWYDYRYKKIASWAMHCVLMTGQLGVSYDEHGRGRMCVMPNLVSGREQKFRADDIIACHLIPAFVQDCHEHLIPRDSMGRAVTYSAVWNYGFLFASRFRFLGSSED